MPSPNDPPGCGFEDGSCVPSTVRRLSQPVLKTAAARTRLLRPTATLVDVSVSSTVAAVFHRQQDQLP